MQEMSPGTALRQLQQAQAGLKKARQLLEAGAGSEGRRNPSVFEGRLGEPGPRPPPDGGDPA